jgi:hypothetical protein
MGGAPRPSSTAPHEDQIAAPPLHRLCLPPHRHQQRRTSPRSTTTTPLQPCAGGHLHHRVLPPKPPRCACSSRGPPSPSRVQTEPARMRLLQLHHDPAAGCHGLTAMHHHLLHPPPAPPCLLHPARMRLPGALRACSPAAAALNGLCPATHLAAVRRGGGPGKIPCAAAVDAPVRLGAAAREPSRVVLSSERRSPV